MDHPPSVGSLGLDALVTEVSERLHAVAAVNDRMRELLDAVVAVSSGLDLHATLQRIATAAVDLADAGYAAVGVLAPHTHGLADFIQAGLTDEQVAAIGELPSGKGILGAIIDDPRPLRLEDLNTDPRAAGFPPGHPPMHSFLSVPIRVRSELFGNIYVTEKKHHGTFSIEDQQVLAALAAAAGVAIENARLYEEGRRRERWIAGAGEVTTVMLTSDDAHAALSIAAEQVRDLAGAALGMILLPTGDGGLRVSHAVGDAAGYVTGQHVPPGDQVARLLAGHSVLIRDMSIDSRTASRISSLFGPSMALPMKSAGRVLGAVAVWRESGSPPFTADEQQLAEAFASQAALALRLAEGQQDQQRLAVYQDRDRIARDLHDLVIQRLFATGMMMETAARQAQVPEVKVRIGKAVDELDATIQEVRTTIYALRHDDNPDGGDLRSKVLREVSQASGPLGFKPSVNFVGPVGTMVGESAGRHLIAALREALSNAARHARASAVTVTVDSTARIDEEGMPVTRAIAGIQQGDDPTAALREAGAGRPAVLLTVADDGIGIPSDGRRSGLLNLADRAATLGGTAWHRPGPDRRGTEVFWTALL